MSGLIAAVAAMSVWSALSHRATVETTGRELDAAILYVDMRQAVLDARYQTAVYLRDPSTKNLDQLTAATYRIFDLARRVGTAGDDADAAFSQNFLARYEVSAENALGSFARFLDLQPGSTPADQLGPMLPLLDERIRDRHDEVRSRIDSTAGHNEGYIGSTVVLAGIGLGLTAAVAWLVASQLGRQADAELAMAHREKEAMERSERRFRTLVQNSNDVILVTDQFGTVKFVSPSVEAMMGYAVEDLVGVNVAAMVHPLDTMKSLDWGNAILASPDGKSDPVTLRIFRKDGSLAQVELRALNLLDEPDVGGLLVTGRDVTAQVAAATEGVRLAALVDATSDMVVVTDADGEILHLNRAARARLGNDSAIGQNIFDFLPPDSRALIDDQAAPEAEAYGSWTGELTIPAPSGLLLNLEIELLAHLDPNGDVTFYSCIARDVSERRRVEAELVQLANHDPLTGLFNRRAFETRVEREVERCLKGGTHAALYFLDLDNFKAVNDGLGHRVGDDLLQHVALVLGSALPAEAVLARIGGDEFGILIPQSETDAAAAYGAVIRDAIRDIRLVAAGRQVSVTTSIGIVMLPGAGASSEGALANADLAMYEAKRQGDAWRFYGPGAYSLEQLTNRTSWEGQIRAALAEDGRRFSLFSQPILTPDGEVVADELLIRIREDSGLLIEPGLFLPVAELSSLVYLIDHWVVHRAIALLAARPPGAPDIAVNISARSFQDGELPPLIRRWLQETGADPARLIVEVTETATVADLDQAISFVAGLSGLGIRFSIDDFGAGFASFSRVRQLPIQRIKVDGAFIRNLASSSDDRQLVRAIVDMAHGLGKEVVAESVEDHATLEIVRRLGVDLVQGFLFGLPVEVELPSLALERLSA
ncbi:MAG: EAL domain-containing protein [Dehalococcoidia bacterium]